jgi:acetyl esterase/lipase
MGKNKWVIILVSVLAIVVIGLGSFYLYATKVEERSVQSILLGYYIKTTGIKDKLVDKEKVTEFMEKGRLQIEEPYKFPGDLKLKSAITMETSNEMEVFFLNRNVETRNKQILYLHGGAYVNQPTSFHWTFLDELAGNAHATVIVPIYPKAPKHQYREAFDKVLPIYTNLMAETGAKNITIMGDSAGGGFALALSQLLLEKGLPQPGNVIMLSPWLDITMKNPDIPALEEKDPMLGAYGLVQMGKAWAGDSDPSIYLLSPINGEVKGLAKISLFVGTHELLFPDASKFKDKAAAQGVMINYFEYPKMNHVFPIFPIPEADKARGQIINIINGIAP